MLRTSTCGLSLLHRKIGMCLPLLVRQRNSLLRGTVQCYRPWHQPALDPRRRSRRSTVLAVRNHEQQPHGHRTLRHCPPSWICWPRVVSRSLGHDLHRASLLWERSIHLPEPFPTGSQMAAKAATPAAHLRSRRGHTSRHLRLASHLKSHPDPYALFPTRPRHR